MDSQLIREIRERNDIVEVISSYIVLQPAGKNHKALCPFHQEKTPSFTVSSQKQLWHCFGCGAGGDVFAFVEKIESIDFLEAARKLAERAGIRWRQAQHDLKLESERQKLLAINQIACQFFEDVLWKSASGEKARDYLKRRGVTLETAKKFRLGYAPDSWEGLTKHLFSKQVTPLDGLKAGILAKTEQGDRFYDRFRDRVMFPIFSPQGDLIGFGGRTLGDSEAKYINTTETPLFSKRKTLYALHLASSKIRAQDLAIVVEGYMDAISLHQNGFENVVATMGTALTSHALSLLKRYSVNIVVAFDGDSAGMEAVLRSSALFLEQEVNVRVMMLPRGMDPDECVRQAGERGANWFQKALEESVTISDYKLNRFLSTPTGKKPSAEGVRQAVGMLLGIGSPMEQEECIRKLAAQWAEGELERVAALEQALRQEMARVQRRAIASSTKTRRNAQQATLQTGSQASATLVTEGLTRSGIPVGVQQAERMVIAGMLQSEQVARRVIASLHWASRRFQRPQLSSEIWVTSMHQLLAQVVAACLESDEFDELTEYIYEMGSDEIKAEATALMLTDATSLESKGVLESLLEVILRYSLTRVVKEQLRQIMPKVEAGKLDRNAPEFQQLWALEQQLKLKGGLIQIGKV